MICQLIIKTNYGNRRSSRKRKEVVKKNKSGVKNSLVKNINARKKKGKSRTKKRSTISKKSYKEMQNKWK